MIITHSSASKIENIEVEGFGVRQGCLFFGYEDNEYNLAGECNYKYSLDVEDTIEARLFFHKHDVSELSDLIEDMELDLEVSRDEAIALLEEEGEVFDAEQAWSVQQYQGKAGHMLGYDAVESFDEQGVVFIVFCGDKSLKEVKVN